MRTSRRLDVWTSIDCNVDVIVDVDVNLVDVVVVVVVVVVVDAAVVVVVVVVVHWWCYTRTKNKTEEDLQCSFAHMAPQGLSLTLIFNALRWFTFTNKINIGSMGFSL